MERYVDDDGSDCYQQGQDAEGGCTVDLRQNPLADGCEELAAPDHHNDTGQCVLWRVHSHFTVMNVRSSL